MERSARITTPVEEREYRLNDDDEELLMRVGEVAHDGALQKIFVVADTLLRQAMSDAARFASRLVRPTPKTGIHAGPSPHEMEEDVVKAAKVALRAARWPGASEEDDARKNPEDKYLIVKSGAFRLTIWSSWSRP